MAEWVEVKGLKGAAGLNFVAVMSDEELTVDEVNIGFDAAESMIEGVEEWAIMFVIIMGMGAGHRGG